MLRRILIPAIAAAAFVAVSAQDASGFELLDRMLGRGHVGHGCCEPACCAPEPACCVPEPVCCAPEPSCCEPICDPCCRRVHFPRLRAFFDRLCHRSCCEPVCCEPVCEPACGFAPSCCH